MDKLSLLGLLVGFGGILIGQVLEGGPIAFLLQGSAFLIVFGGTLGAVMLHHPPVIFRRALAMVKWVFIPPVLSLESQAADIVTWSHTARKDGILALEQYYQDAQDPFVKKGLQLLVDGNTAEKLREVLEVEINVNEQQQWQSARVWESAAGYAPTIGIIGAVLGLIHIMQSLANPEQLGAGVAVAFVSTIYGVGLANLVFMPMAGKLKILIAQRTTMQEMLVDGLASIANGENPRFVESKMQGYLL